MKKLMMLAAMLAMVLVAAVPALAQDTETIGATDQSITTEQYCLAAFGDQDLEQNVSGDENETGAINNQQQYCAQLAQNAQADDGSIAANLNDSEISVDVDGDGDVDEADAEAAAAASAAASASAGASAGSGSGASAGSSSSAGELPATGGVSLLTLGAGALLVAGGLVARRIVR